MVFGRWLCVASAVFVASLGGVVATAGAVGADGLADAQTQAGQLEAEIQTSGQHIDALDQAYQGAQLQAQAIDGKVASTQTQIGLTKSEIVRERQHLRSVVVHSYVTGSAAASGDQVFGSDPSAAAAAGVYSQVAQGDLSVAVDQLNSTEATLNAEEATLRTEQDAAQHQLTEANAAFQEAQALQSQQRQELAQVNSHIQELISAQQQAALAAAQAAARTHAQDATPVSTGGSQVVASPSVSATATATAAAPATGPAATATVPPNSAGAAAVAAAESQLGVPYVWAAESPGSGFDCSGLTEWAWGQAGVSLPHFSGAQMAATTPVPTSDLQPGDLLFYGPAGSDHVAMYVSPGTMIEAPYTGATVRLTPLRFGDGFVGAGRP